MGNLSQTLQIHIVNDIIEILEERFWVANKCKIPPLPSPQELSAMLQATAPYTKTTNRTNLSFTDHVMVHSPEQPTSFKLKLDPPQPVCHIANLLITDEWTLNHYGDTMQIHPGPLSERRKIRGTATSSLQTARQELSRSIRDVRTLARFLDHFPEWKDLPRVQEAIRHEIDVRKNATQARKNAKPLEAIELTAELSVIAKARLLGAKYVT
jgi:hypothetical protein